MQKLEETLKALFLSSLDGDEVAYHDFLVKLEKVMKNYVPNIRFAYGKSKQDQDEIIQEILLKVHTKKHTYQRELKILPWIFTIARNTVIDHVRGIKNQVRLVSYDEAQLSLELDKDFSHQEFNLLILDEIKDLLKKLPLKHKEILVMAKAEGYTSSEIAKIKGISNSAVKISIFRSLKSVFIRGRE